MRLPPYGKMSEEYIEFVHDRPMTDWLPDQPLTERQRSFVEWREAMRGVVADHVWPWFDRSTNKWVGKAAEWADAASGAEVAIMMEHLQAEPRHIDRIASSPGAINVPNSHYHHFKIEDDLAQDTAVNLGEYDRTLAPSEIKAATTIANNAYATKLNGLFWIKHQLVRPRPYQVAMIVGKHDFRSHTSRLALHSSCNSGHCIEGLLFSCAIADAWLSGATAPDQTRMASLKQYAVDFGDRRVFAGVHYPSDNIASWVIALDLIPHVFKDSRRIMDFAIDAIVNHSTVYGVVQKAFPKVPELAPALSLLNSKVVEVSSS